MYSRLSDLFPIFYSCDFFPLCFPTAIRRTDFSLASSWNFTDWFPKMCSCIDGNSTLPNNRAVGRTASYERLGSDLTIFELSSPMRRSRRGNQDLIDRERQVRVKVSHA